MREPPKPPRPPLNEWIREGDDGCPGCPECGSSVDKRFLVFGRKSCINPDCGWREGAA